MARNDRRSSQPQPSPEELAAALSQFNKGVETSKDLDRRQRKIDKADRRRKDAAARMKTVIDGEPSAEEREAAESEYRVAVEEWQELVSGSPDAELDDAAGEPQDEQPPAEASTESETSTEEDDPDPEPSASS